MFAYNLSELSFTHFQCILIEWYLAPAQQCYCINIVFVFQDWALFHKAAKQTLMKREWSDHWFNIASRIETKVYHREKKAKINIYHCEDSGSYLIPDTLRSWISFPFFRRTYVEKKTCWLWNANHEQDENMLSEASTRNTIYNYVPSIRVLVEVTHCYVCRTFRFLSIPHNQSILSRHLEFKIRLLIWKAHSARITLSQSKSKFANVSDMRKICQFRNQWEGKRTS